MKNDVIMPNMKMVGLNTFLYISIALIKSYKVRGFRVEKSEKVAILDGNAKFKIGYF